MNQKLIDHMKQFEKNQSEQLDIYGKLWQTIEKNRFTLNEMIHIKVGEIDNLKKKFSPFLDELEKQKAM